MGARHARAYTTQQPGVRVVLVDRRRAVAAALARSLAGAEVASPAEYARMEGLAGVDVCTPPAEHARLVAAALVRGLPTLCETPLATRPGDEAALLGGDGGGAWLGVGYPYRHHPAMRWVGRMLAEGRVGRPFAAYLRLGVIGGRSAWQHRLGREGGGVGSEVLAHLADLALGWFGPVASVRLLATDVARPVRRVRGRWLHIAAPDTAVVEVVHESGCHSLLMADLAATSHFQSVEIQGGDGSLWASVRPGFPGLVRGPGDTEVEWLRPGEPVDTLGSVVAAFLDGLAIGGVPEVLRPRAGVARILADVEDAMRGEPA